MTLSVNLKGRDFADRWSHPKGRVAVEKYLGKRGKAPVGKILPPSTDSIAQRARIEHVVHLSDMIRRRLPDGLDTDLGQDKAVELSNIAAAALSWSEERRQAELGRFKEETARSLFNA